MRRELVAGVSKTRQLLASTPVAYEALRTSLTPQSDKVEVALVVDSNKVGNGWYGRSVHDVLLPLLRRSGTHAVLRGDLLHEAEAGSTIWEMLHSEVRCPRDVHVSRLIDVYCVYVNNCSQWLAEAIVRTFVENEWCLGYADVSFNSPLNADLSTCLGQGHVTLHDHVLQPHPDGLETASNENTLGCDVEEHGFDCVSIPELYYGLFLRYKIERPVLPGFESDQLHSLNAIVDAPVDLTERVIEIADEKLQYLRQAKMGSMKRLGVLEEPKATLENLIRGKLKANYLYNMRFRSDCSVSTFKLMPDLQALDTGKPVRAVAALAYETDRNAIRLVTLY